MKYFMFIFIIIIIFNFYLVNIFQMENCFEKITIRFHHLELFLILIFVLIKFINSFNKKDSKLH